jgi:hypothetical protein
MFKNTPRVVVALAAATLLATQSAVVFSQQFQIASLTTASAPSSRTINSSPEVILSQFLASESKVREALNQHTFKRDVTLQTIGPNGEVTGEYVRNSQFIFDNSGHRIERVLFHPKSTIREMRITKEDIQDLAGAQLLGIDITETGKYNLTYVGAETVDSQPLIAIDVNPQLTPDPHHMSERFFVGRVWLDPNTCQIVKIKGVVEPQGKQRFPLFETWRAIVKGPLAFPVRTEADDVLHFLERDVHYRIKVRYYDYQLFGSRVSVKELDENVPETNTAPTQAPLQNSPPANDLKSLGQPPAPPILKKSSAPGWSMGPTKQVESCEINRTAPPIGDYHWPVDSKVKVFFMRNAFTPEQRAAALEAMTTWSAESADVTSGVTFVDAGETDSRQTCQGCLTIRRNDVLKQDHHHYAFFYPMNRVDRLLVSAWIDLDFGIQKPDALKSFLVHELGHGLGLWDCTSCKKKQTIMNAFPGLNKDNGLQEPSRCDLATVRAVYQEERYVARAPLSSASLNAASVNKVVAGSGAAVQSVTPKTDSAKVSFAHSLAQWNGPATVQLGMHPRENPPLIPQPRSVTSPFSILDLQHWNFSEFSGWRSGRY